MNDTIDLEVWENNTFWGIRNSKKIFEDAKLAQYQCEILGKMSKEYIEEYLSNEEGKKVELIINE